MNKMDNPTPSILIPLHLNNNILATLEIPLQENWGHTVADDNSIEIFHKTGNTTIACILISSSPGIPPNFKKAGYPLDLQEKRLMIDFPELFNWEQERKLILNRWSHLSTAPPADGHAFVRRHSFSKTLNNELRLIILSGVAKIDGIAPQPEIALKGLIKLASAIKFLSLEETYTFNNDYQ